jgi:hypothetical protein
MIFAFQHCQQGKKSDALWYAHMHTTFSPLIPSFTTFAIAQVQLDNMECCIAEGWIILVLLHIHLKNSHITMSENSDHTNFVTNHNLINDTIDAKNFQPLRQVSTA